MGQNPPKNLGSEKRQKNSPVFVGRRGAFFGSCRRAPPEKLVFLVQKRPFQPLLTRDGAIFGFRRCAQIRFEWLSPVSTDLAVFVREFRA